MAKSPLTETQRKVRRMLVRSGGTMSNPEIAEELGLSRVTVWRAKRAIHLYRPLPEYSTTEEKEIQAQIRHLDDLEEQLMDELGVNEDALISVGPNESRVGLMQIRLGLLNQMRQLKKDRATFLMDVGRLRRVPTSHLITPNSESDLSNLDDPAKLDAEITKMEKILNVVGARRS